MLIGIIPKIKKNHTEYEFSVDLNLINFLYFVFPKSNCEIIYSKDFDKKIDMLILSGFFFFYKSYKKKYSSYWYMLRRSILSKFF